MLSIDKILESPNIAEELSDDELNKIASTVLESYEVDEDSRADWKRMTEGWLKLAVQVTDKKTFPWTDAANVKYPLVTLAAFQFNSRALPSFINQKDTVKGRVIGKATTEKSMQAKRISQYMSYQVNEEMEEWEEDMDKLLVYLPIVGTAYKKTYFDPDLGRCKSELVLADDLVVNYYAKSFEQAARKTHRMYMYPNEFESYIRSGVFIDVDYSEASKTKPDYFRISKESQGISPPSHDKDTPFEILEQHRWLDLDDDGYEEPYIVTVNKDINKVVRIVPRFDSDTVFMNEKKEIQKIVADEYFTKFICFPDPESDVLGYGFGRLLGPINETINTSTNQLLDAGTLANLQCGYLSRSVKIQGGNSPFRPGEWKTLNVAADDLRKGIFPLPIKEPSNVLLGLLSLMIEAGQQVGSFSDAMLGKNPGQNQPYSTTSRMLEEGMKVFNSIHKRIHRSLKKEFKKLYKLNSYYLEEEKYFTVLDEKTEQQGEVFRVDFDLDSIDVLPASDPDVTSEAQEMAKAEALLAFVQMGTVNPQVATQRILESQNQSGIEDLMQPPPPPPPSPDYELKLAEFQHEQQMDMANYQKELIEIQSQMFKDKSTAILALTKAQALEDKTDLDFFRVQLEAMDKQEQAIVKKLEVMQNNKKIISEFLSKSNSEATKERIANIPRESGDQ